jgi:hypothetical protein
LPTSQDYIIVHKDGQRSTRWRVKDIHMFFSDGTVYSCTTYTTCITGERNLLILVQQKYLRNMQKSNWWASTLLYIVHCRDNFQWWNILFLYNLHNLYVAETIFSDGTIHFQHKILHTAVHSRSPWKLIRVLFVYTVFLYPRCFYPLAHLWIWDLGIHVVPFYIISLVPYRQSRRSGLHFVRLFARQSCKPVFRSCFLSAYRYSFDIWYIALPYQVTHQVRIWSWSIDFSRSYGPLT